jgi:ADP-heptose:LPS heptosyltransferase
MAGGSIFGAPRAVVCQRNTMNLRAKLFLDYYVGGFLHAVLRIPTILLGKLLRRDHDLSRCREIAVLKLLGGGSLVIAYPALLALRCLPGLEKLTLVTSSAIAPFGALLGVFDEIIVLRDDHGPVTLAADSLRAWWKLFRYDALIDLEIHSRLTTVFAVLTAARNRIGFFTNISFWRRHLSTHLLFCNITNGIYDFYDQLAALFGVSPADAAECEREFRARLGEHGFEGGPFRLAIAPACSGLSRERMLRAEEWVEVVARRLARIDSATLELHLLGGPADRAEIERMKTLLEARFGDRAAVDNHAGRTSLRESVRILAAMDEVLCIDSALLHFSRLLGRPTVSFWGPTDPRTLLRPDARGLDEIHYVKIPCSPCVHMSHQPPCKGQNICMRLAVDPAAPLPRNQSWVLNG